MVSINYTELKPRINTNVNQKKKKKVAMSIYILSTTQLYMRS